MELAMLAFCTAVIVFLLAERMRVDRRAEVLSSNDDALLRDVKKLRRDLDDMAGKIREAEELIELHKELEKEAAKSERLFQEGLTNILNYGVTDDG